jgi:hypothetical protein
LVGRYGDHHVGHVAIITRSLSKDLALKVLLGKLRLLVLAALTLRHLRREDTRSDRVDPDLETIVADLETEHLGKVDDSGLGGIVGEVVLCRLHDTGNTAYLLSSFSRLQRQYSPKLTYINHTTGVTVLKLSGLLKKREEAHLKARVQLAWFFQEDGSIDDSRRAIWWHVDCAICNLDLLS